MLEPVAVRDKAVMRGCWAGSAQERPTQRIGRLSAQQPAKVDFPEPDIASRAGLRLGGWLLAAALAACQPAPVKPPPNGPAAQLKLGLQAYTFRQYSFAETLDLARGLGLHYVQAFPGQTLGGGLEGSFGHRLDMAARTRIRALLAAADVRLVSYGVVTRQGTRPTGGKSSPLPGTWALKTSPANRPGTIWRWSTASPGNREWRSPSTIIPRLRVTTNWIRLWRRSVSPYGLLNMGICADTGHWVRSGDDPVVSLRRAAGRILAVHFKDLDERGVVDARDVPWGTGVANAAGQLAELRRQRFSGVIFIEYEHATPSLLDDVARCIQFFKRAALASDADLAANRVPCHRPAYTTEISDTWEGGIAAAIRSASAAAGAVCAGSFQCADFRRKLGLARGSAPGRRQRGDLDAGGTRRLCRQPGVSLRRKLGRRGRAAGRPRPDGSSPGG